MNLFAFANIGNVSEVAARNNIYVPRLRGYLLMKDQQRCSDQDIAEQINSAAIDCCMDGCHCKFLYHGWSEYSWKTKIIEKKHLVRNPEYGKDHDGETYIPEWIGIRWENIHGKKRKALKFEIKKRKRRILAQDLMWNKFCGRDDVLYAHARIGGGNWSVYRKDVESQDRYICRVDDSFDSTYCDIYFRIDPVYDLVNDNVEGC